MKLKNIKHRLALLILGAVLVLLALGVWGSSQYYFYLLSPVQRGNSSPVIVKIQEGSNIRTIGTLLEKKGLIRKAWAFEFYARWNHINNYHSGTYKFTRSYSVGRMMNDLNSGKHRKIMFVINVRQGMWIKDIAGKIATVTGESQNDILQQLASRSYVQTHYMKKYPFLTSEILAKGIKFPLEGYLAPGSYYFTQGKKAPTLDQVIDPMLDQTGKTLKHFSKPLAANSLGSVHKVLTLASMVEQEAPGTKSRKMIAGVLYNRLKKNMRLQTDPSVAYGEQKQVVAYSHNDFRKDYKQSNPYNTYTHQGLPVGPIGSPAEDAVDAVLNPIQSKDYYFYARPNGKIYYSETYAQHQKIVAKYEHEWSAK